MNYHVVRPMACIMIPVVIACCFAEATEAIECRTFAPWDCGLIQPDEPATGEGSVPPYRAATLTIASTTVAMLRTPEFLKSYHA